MPTLTPMPQAQVQATTSNVHEEGKKTQKKQKKTKEEASGSGSSSGSGSGSHVCNICSAPFSSAGSLRFHSYHHSPKARRFSCIGCHQKCFEKDKDKEEHELLCEINLTGSKFNCLFCDLPFSTPKNLRKHENRHRPAKKTKKFKHMCVCIKCNKAFDAIYTLKLHIKKIHGGNASPDKIKKKKLVKEDNEMELLEMGGGGGSSGDPMSENNFVSVKHEIEVDGEVGEEDAQFLVLS